MTPAAHLYVHMPFCASRCGYCAFVVETDALGMRDAYLAALLQELDREAADLGPLDSVYIGGGTPSLMRPRRIARLLSALDDRIGPETEISMEANPESVDQAALAGFRAAGVNRLSLGAQSFSPRLLDALDRGARPEQVRAAVACARRAGFTNLSIDLLFGVPGQDAADLEADIAEALALEPDHISWYELEIKPATALARMGVAAVDDDLAADSYRRIVDALEGAGYRWYETANFARPGHECRHNLAYWGAADYLGLGIGAVSTLGGVRRRNLPGLTSYVTDLGAGREPRREREILDEDTRRRERWMLGLRRDLPLDLDWAGPPDRPEALARLRDAGLLVGAAGRPALTREGRFIQNAVLHELIEY